MTDSFIFISDLSLLLLRKAFVKPQFYLLQKKVVFGNNEIAQLDSSRGNVFSCLISMSNDVLYVVIPEVTRMTGFPCPGVPWRPLPPRSRFRCCSCRCRSSDPRLHLPLHHAPLEGRSPSWRSCCRRLTKPRYHHLRNRNHGLLRNKYKMVGEICTIRR